MAEAMWALPPPLLPAGAWDPLALGPGGRGVITRLPSGLVISLADEHYPPDDPWNGDPELVGTFRRAVFSYPHHYPKWEEMRDWITRSGIFDRTRCVHMLLPPERYYVNVQSFAMHWMQRIEAPRG